MSRATLSKLLHLCTSCHPSYGVTITSGTPFLVLLQVSTVEESRSTEVITMRNAYDHEIGSLRSALDDTSREKARFEINADKFEKEVRDLNARLKEKEKALESSQKEVKILQTQHTSMLSDLDLAKSELNELRPEKARLVKQVADAKRNLEEETLRRIDVQNQLQTSQEGLKFENSLLEQQLNETKTRKAIEISEIDGKLHEKYEEKLQKSLAVSTIVNSFAIFVFVPCAFIPFP